MAYVRHEDETLDKNPVLVILNFGRAAKVRLQLPERFEPLGASGSLRDALTDTDVRVSKRGRRLEVSVPGSGALLLTSPRTP
jgi:hypothetical protein